MGEQLGHRVAAVLLEDGVGEHEGEHRLADDAGGGQRGDVAALVLGCAHFAAVEVDRRSPSRRVAIGFL